MLKPIRLMLTSFLASIPFVMPFAAPRFAMAQASSASLEPASLADLSATDLLVFGVIGLAAASAAIAVRMVRRSH